MALFERLCAEGLSHAEIGRRLGVSKSTIGRRAGRDGKRRDLFWRDPERVALFNRLLDPAARVTSGRIVFGGIDLLTAGERALEEMRGREVSLISQNPRGALNPIRPSNCAAVMPELRPLEGGRSVACHYPEIAAAEATREAPTVNSSLLPFQIPHPAS